MTGDGMNANQQMVDELRQRLAAYLHRWAELAADTAQADAVRRLDAGMTEHCRTIADIERSLRNA
jgi:hypothetical protein